MPFVARIVMPLTLAISIAVTGCGGNSEDTSTEYSAAKAAFLRKASAACKKERVGLKAEASSFLRRFRGKRPSEDLYADVAQLVLLPAIEAEVWGIEKLIEERGAPPGDEQQVDALLDADRLAIDATAVRRTLPSLEAAYRHFVPVGKLFRAYGLPACANGPERSAEVV